MGKMRINPESPSLWCEDCFRSGKKVIGEPYVDINVRFQVGGVVSQVFGSDFASYQKMILCREHRLDRGASKWLPLADAIRMLKKRGEKDGVQTDRVKEGTRFQQRMRKIYGDK